MTASPIPVVFIHGLWIHSDAWQPWVELYRSAGYDATAPGWPGDAASVDDTRKNPDAVANNGIDDITDATGLGGERTMRGYRQDRFIGLVAAGASAEVRWTFAKFGLFQQHFSLQVAPFVDSGRVFHQVGLSLDDWKISGGAGLRVGYNQSTIVMFDFGASRLRSNRIIRRDKQH